MRARLTNNSSNQRISHVLNDELLPVSVLCIFDCEASLVCKYFVKAFERWNEKITIFNYSDNVSF